MGVQSLWDIVGPSARPVRLEALSKKKLAVDASIWIYQFLKAVRDKEGNALPQSHIVGFFRRICKLLYFGIRPIFVFDGGVPILKRETINERKNRRQKKSESTRDTAQKLLAIQLQREAENSTSLKPPSNKKKIGNSKDFNEEDDVVYFDDLPINQAIEEDKTKSPESKLIKFRKKDEYHLPDLHEFKVSKNDERLIPDEEYIESYEDFDTVDGININEVDPKSKEFAKLPISTQYMILNHLRLKSRLRLGYRKDQLEDLFPDSMDFSKFQIQQVQRRNFFTQKLMDVTGMNEDSNVARRIAGDRDKKYALVKNNDGWTLALQNDGTNENPINLDDDDVREIEEYAHKTNAPIVIENEESNEEKSDDEFEDVPLEEVEETEEEKNMSRAMIASIYDQYNDHPKPFYEEANKRDDEVLRKAVEDSKREYFKMIDDENHLAESDDNDNDLDFGSSILFANPGDTNKKTGYSGENSTNRSYELKPAMTFNKPKNKNVGKIAPNWNNRSENSSSANSDINKFRKHLPVQAKETNKAESHRMKNLSSAFLFNNDSHETGRINIASSRIETPLLSGNEEVVSKQNQRSKDDDLESHSHLRIEKDFNEETPKQIHDSENESINNKNFEPLEFNAKTSKQITDTKKENLNEKNVFEPIDFSGDSPKQINDTRKEGINDKNIFEPLESDEEIEDAKVTSVKITESPKGKRKLPEWFQDEVGKTLNPHNEKFISYNEYNTKDREKEEDQEAGLIPWYEVKEYLQDGQSPQEVDHESEVEEINPSTMVHTSPATKDNKIELHQERKAAVIDYDFEEEEEDNLVKQLESEEADHENLKSQIKTSHSLPASSMETRITDEQLLQEQLQKSKRDSDEVTESMINDVQELLKRFGIPYITAPMEAEAQCAELLKIGLVDGIVTDDSDCFLFGGDKIYKNMFNQKQYVECYLKDDINHKIGLSQQNMIELALLLGSDYTEGIKGIGPVLAMEILAEFGSLQKLKDWFDENTKTSKAMDKKNATSLQKNLLTRIKNGKLYLPDNFPEKVVFDAYILPTVDHDKTEFKWGVPNLDQIRSFLMYNVQWSQAKVDEVMIPLIRDMNKKKAEGTQSTIGEFFPQEYIQSRKELNLGKRMKTAANKLNKKKKL